MTQESTAHTTGRWTFDLHMAQSLQLRIISEQDADAKLIIEGHDISTLLDYLYEQRQHIYDATHDQETRLREAAERPTTLRQKAQQVEPIRYFYDGEVRIRADQDTLMSNQQKSC